MAEEKQHRTYNTIIIQCLFRRKLAYRRYWEKRRHWLMRVIMPRFQAFVRGKLQRIKFRRIMWQVTRIKSATRIQAAFRKFVKERDLREAIRQKKLRIFITRKATIIQAGWAGMKSRRRVQAMRNAHANRLLAQARQQVKVLLYRIHINPTDTLTRIRFLWILPHPPIILLH